MIGFFCHTPGIFCHLDRPLLTLTRTSATRSSPSMPPPLGPARSEAEAEAGGGGGGVLELLPDSSYLEFVLLDTYSSTNCFHTREVLKSTPVASSKGGPEGVWAEVATGGEWVWGGRDNRGASGMIAKGSSQ